MTILEDYIRVISSITPFFTFLTWILIPEDIKVLYICLNNVYDFELYDLGTNLELYVN